VAFNTEPGTGWWRIGAADAGFALNGAKKIEVLPTAINFTNAVSADSLSTTNGISSGTTLSAGSTMTLSGGDLLLTKTGAQAVTKTGGALTLGTGDANDVSLVRNGTAQIQLLTSGPNLPYGATFSGNLTANQAAPQVLTKSGGQLTIQTSDANQLVLRANNMDVLAIQPSGNAAFFGNRIVNVGTPTASDNAATMGYVDGKVAGVSAVPGMTSPTLPAGVDPVTGLALSTIFGFTETRTRYGCWTPVSGTTSFALSGAAESLTAVNLTSQAWAASPQSARLPHVRSLASGVPLLGFNEAGPAGAWRGTSAGLGGFIFYATWASSQVDTSVREAVGLAAAPTTINTTNPQTRANVAYFGCTAQANMQFCSNDATGSATCTDLGTNFPCNTQASQLYSGAIWAAPNASSLSWAITRLDAGPYTVSNTVSAAADLPANNVSLGWQAMVQGTGGTSGIDLYGACLIWNP
jgi:hypothetical protein